MASIGIFGGSGLYDLLENVKEHAMKTPYGDPSSEIAIGSYHGKEIAFLARHGKKHTLPPHAINYRANVWAMKELGVKYLFSPTAAGSLQSHIKPGDFVVVDQFIDRTNQRPDTFYDGPITTHISCLEPYCPYLRDLAIQSIKTQGVQCHDTGTVVVIQGPRFSSKAESQWFANQGWAVINMTQYPEVVLAKELEISYVNIALITDYDACLLDDFGVPVSEMMTVFKQNVDNIQKVLFHMIDACDIEKDCPSHSALATAQLNA